jgi:hypothetical protein
MVNSLTLGTYSMNEILKKMEKNGFSRMVFFVEDNQVTYGYQE